MERAFSLREDHPLHRWIRGLTEHTFMQCLGLGDPRIVDYLSDLLIRSVSADSLAPVSPDLSDSGLQTLNQLEKVVSGGTTDITMEAFRRLGDRNLFLTGVFPESAEKRNAWRGGDLKMMTITGKRAYQAACVLDRTDGPVLRSLSEQFEICATGLRQVRKAWEAESACSGGRAIWNS